MIYYDYYHIIKIAEFWTPLGYKNKDDNIQKQRNCLQSTFENILEKRKKVDKKLQKERQKRKENELKDIYSSPKVKTLITCI